MFDFPESDESVMYQILQASTSVLQQGVEDHTGCSGTVGLRVHQTIKQNKQQGAQLLLGQTLTDDLKHRKRGWKGRKRVCFNFTKRDGGSLKISESISALGENYIEAIYLSQLRAGVVQD